MLDIIFALAKTSDSYLKLSDFLNFQNTLNTMLLGIIGILTTVLIAFGGFMITRIDKLREDMNNGQTALQQGQTALQQGQTALQVSIAEIKAIMSMTKSIELGISQEDVLEQAAKEAKSKLEFETLPE
jgi:type II secretory pathway pseudopilin PulG